MLKTTTTAPEPKQSDPLTIAFQDFNGVFLAKISNLKDKETFAYGKSRSVAEINALKNFNRKYNSTFATL